MGQVDPRLVIPDVFRLRYSFIGLASLSLSRSVCFCRGELIGGYYLFLNLLKKMATNQ